MRLDNGLATIKRGTYSASSASMPSVVWTEIYTSYYGEKTVGINRYYAALDHDDRADLIIEIQRNGGITTADQCVLDSLTDSGTSGTYKIIQVQHVLDDDGNPMTDLTLERVSGIDS